MNHLSKRNRRQTWLALMICCSLGLPATTFPAPAQAATTRSVQDQMGQEIQAMSEKIGTMMELVNSDPQGAVQLSRSVKQHAARASQLFKSGQASIPAAERPLWADILLFFHTMIDDGTKTAQLMVQVSRLNELNQQVESGGGQALLVPQLQLIERALKELAADWDIAAKLVDRLRAKHGDEQVGLTEAESQAFRELGVTYRQLAQQYTDKVQEIQAQNPGQTPDFRKFEPASRRKNDVRVTPELEALFKPFDKDKDGVISLGEGENFYYWVEKHVSYRYDNENARNPHEGTTVGDGRPGFDYRQRAWETLKEKQGDCEDMATLEAVFYRYFGHDAYVLGVNAQHPEEVDHAVAVLKISGNPQQYRQVLGDLVAYDIQAGTKDITGKPVPPGTYMLVDNAYSSSYGYVSGGLEPGTFKPMCVVPADDIYDKQWDYVDKHCKIPMD